MLQAALGDTCSVDVVSMRVTRLASSPAGSPQAGCVTLPAHHNKATIHRRFTLSMTIFESHRDD
ncbi:hypothetical protein E2C01_088946 [Portunus trituberculatus]|uniref:Uncharacterized protein n=1 Tax=Portunus trituberculatus TaxID=210409 RepID=A0A5B7JN93_PORTR|nr:hypothetical protein [Portunus trituberculatus]